MWFYWPYVMIFAGSFLAAAGGLWAARVQQKESVRLLGQVTGGDSVVYLQPLRKDSRVRYFVRQIGGYPSYDVVVRIQEILPLSDGGRRTRRLIFGPTHVGWTVKRGSGFDWTYPDPQTAGTAEWPLIFTEPPPAGAMSREFRVELAARNGIVVQRLQVLPVGDRWHTDSRRGDRGARLTLPPDFTEAQEQPASPPAEYDEE